MDSASPTDGRFTRISHGYPHAHVHPHMHMPSGSCRLQPCGETETGPACPNLKFNSSPRTHHPKAFSSPSLLR
ncbi:uncharacterized protein LAJ45_03381 [Morchella importuna]|uniref:uncharacterized protein n=1 Tax=Morchella importuna TaxID=1174673 RepID=UPI001E8E8554|nr:uncharacterized protein LAJ45_03381 [Morchella importuna]KAH8152541.1 hypothetical protein LAJ45_03381 [Morchella importuna]